MWIHDYFSQSEFDLRLQAVRKEMAKRKLEVFLVSSPENIFYLTGLDHQGHFAYQMHIRLERTRENRSSSSSCSSAFL